MARLSMDQINATMIAASAAQEAPNNASKVWNNDFPLMQTPLNRKILVYIPADVEQRKVELLIHDTHKGKMFGQARCINGLSAGFEQAGYTGECPYCKATEAAWELYNFKLDQKAKELGVTRDNDPDELLKGTKENLLKEMAVKNADKYICFPVVILPSDNLGNLDPNSQEPCKAVYVLWRKQRYDDKFSSDVLDGRESPAGTFERWSFTYDTKGQQPNAMLSAKALTVKIIEKADQLAALVPYTEACEKVAAPFTQAMAIDNIKALNFYPYADIEADAEACIKPTRAILAAAQAMGTVADANALPQAQTAAPQIGSAESAVANFGGVDMSNAQPMGTVGGVGTVPTAPAFGAMPNAGAEAAPVAPITPVAPVFGS